MKHTPQPTTTRIRNLKSLISDGVKLKFSRLLLLSYNNQLKKLILEHEQDKTKGFLIDNTKNVIENVNHNVNQNVNQNVCVNVSNKILIEKVIEKALQNTLSVYPCMPSKKMVYVGGLGYMSENKSKRIESRANKLYRGITFKENKQTGEYIKACNMSY